MADAEFNVDGRSVLVDSDISHVFDQYTWRYVTRGRKSYVATSTSSHGKRVHMYLHRVVLGDKPGFVVDHINGDTLDNRRCNLRWVTPTQNAMNAKKKPSKHGNRFRGISTRRYGFGSQIRVDGKIVSLGSFRTDVEAAYAYDVASLSHHGEFGRTNFLPLVK